MKIKSPKRTRPLSWKGSAKSSPRATGSDPQSNMFVQCRTRRPWTFPKLQLYGWKVIDPKTVPERRSFMMHGPLSTKEMAKKEMRRFLSSIKFTGHISSFRIKGKWYRFVESDDDS